MSSTDFETKYNHVLKLGETIIKTQKEYSNYRASSDMEKLKRLHTEFMKLIDAEKLRKQSGQKELF